MQTDIKPHFVQFAEECVRAEANYLAKYNYREHLVRSQKIS